ncbi:MAG: hypothetical protein ACKOKG_08045 [Verrucomicrobiota bacterium]
MPQAIDIQGRFISPASVCLRSCGAVLLIGLSALAGLQLEWNTGDDTNGMFFALACFALIGALALPRQEHTYLDLVHPEVVSKKCYFGIKTSEIRRPLKDFSHIVVRHLCHPGGEGPDTYTGSVGLKPVDGSAALWIRDFPATEDEVPSATHEFARELQRWTGFPMANTTDLKAPAPSKS